MMEPAEEMEIENFATMINSMHKSVQLEGLRGLRRLISLGDNPTIEKVVDSGLVPKLFEMTTLEDETELQMESSWCIVNICVGKDKAADNILELGGPDMIMSLFGSKNEDVVWNAIASLQNLVGTGTKYRDFCLERDCVSRLLEILDRSEIKVTIFDQAISALSSLCAGKPSPRWEKLLPALPALHLYISERYSINSLADALWALVAISEEEGNIRAIINQDCLPPLIDCLKETNPDISMPALRTLANVLTGTNSQTTEVLRWTEFLPRVFELTTNESKAFRKLAFFAISNIAATSSDLIDTIFENDNYIVRPKTAIVTEQEEDVAYEAAWAVCNMISGGDGDQVDDLVHKHGILEIFTDLLTRFPKDIKKEALGAIYMALSTDYCDRNFAVLNVDFSKPIREAGLLEIIKDLAKDKDFKKEANQILKYFAEKKEKKKVVTKKKK